MAYSRTQLITQLRQLLNEPTPGFWLDAELGDWLDQGAIDVSARGRCVEAQESIVTTSTVSIAYALPSNLIGIEAVLVDNHYALTKARLRQFGHTQDGGQAGPPSLYARWNGFLWISPTPDSSYDLTVMYWGTTADVTILPDHYQILALIYALMMAKMKEEKAAVAAQLYSIYSGWLEFQRQDLQDYAPESKEMLRVVDRIVNA